MSNKRRAVLLLLAVTFLAAVGFAVLKAHRNSAALVEVTQIHELEIDANASGRQGYTLVGIRVDPPDSNVSIQGAGLIKGARNISENKAIISNLSKWGSAGAVSEFCALRTPRLLELNRGYETDGKKVVYESMLPIVFEVSHPGFKTWRKEIVPTTGRIDMFVALEPDSDGVRNSYERINVGKVPEGCMGRY